MAGHVIAPAAPAAVIARFFSRRTLHADRFLYATPAGRGLAAEAVEFPSGDGVTLRGWLLPGSKRGTVVFCPGNAGNVSSHLEYLGLPLRAGYSVLGFDYRGFGRSDGEPSLPTIVRDVEAACDFVVGRGRGPYALFGLSLGAGAALAAAGRGGREAAGLVLEGAYDLPAMLVGLLADGWFGPVRIRNVVGRDGARAPRVRQRLVAARVPGWAARLLGRLAAACYPFEGRSPAALVPSLGEKPVLLVHGAEDQILPFEAALDVHRRLGGHGRLWLVPGTGHAQEPALMRGPEYVAQLADFLGGAFAGEGPSPPAVRISDGPGDRPGAVRVRASLRPPSPGSTGAPPGPVLLSVAGGDVLAQVVLEGPEEAVLELPGPVESVLGLRIFYPGGDATAEQYVRDGYQAAFRAMVDAVNRRRLAALDAALGIHMRLPRDGRFDFFAALYCLRAAQAAMGTVPSWRTRDLAVARRSLDRFLLLWTANPALPGDDVPKSPLVWARRQRRALGATANPAAPFE